MSWTDVVHDAFTIVGFFAMVLMLTPLYCIGFAGSLAAKIFRRLFKCIVFIAKNVNVNGPTENATEVDALKALVRALAFQQEKIVKLESDQKDVRGLKKRVTTAEKERTVIESRLEASEKSKSALELKVKELEADNNMKSQQILKLEELLRLNTSSDNDHNAVFTDQVTDSESDDDAVPQCGLDNALHNELRELKEENQRLRQEMSEMSESHARSQKLNESKITILTEMKDALETQVNLLEAK